jgi:hypothetical protein
MATAYTTSLKLALPTQGELTGTWGDTLNNQVTSMIEEAVAGLKTINTWSTNSATLSTADGTTSESRAAILNLTDTTSDLSGAGTVICPAASKVYIVKNATGQTITVKTASGSGIAIPDGTTGFVYCDGTNVLEALTNVAGNLVVGGNASIGGNLTVTGTTTFNGGTLTLGDANTDNIVFGGEVDSNIIPDDDDTHDLGSSSKKWKDIYIDGIAYIDAVNLAGTAITATAAEINILDGVTSTASELNILDGVTSTAAELNILDGVTATTAELNILDGVTASAADINLIDGITNGTVSASKAVIVDSNKDISGFRNLSITGDLTVAGDDITMGTNTSGNLLVADGTNFNSVAVGDLSEISSVANDDVFLAVDTSGGGLKKITRSTIVSGLAVGGVALSNIVEDTTPQLGGNLDMNGQDIVTTSNANIELAANGTGKVVVKGNTNQGAIQLNCEANSHGQIIIAAPHSESASNTLTLPSTGGDARLVSTSSTATLTNKTLTDPVITNMTGSTITLDSAGDITLDAGGADILLKDDGTTYGGLSNNSGELLIKSGTTTAMTFSGANVTLEGNLTVSGTTTTVNSTTVNLNDHNIVLDSGNSTSAVVNGAGITIEGGSGDDATFSYNTTGPKFELKLGSNHEDLQVDQLIAASLDISGDVDVDGTLETDALSINGTTVTSTAAELNILDGVTSTASELNILDGVTSTTAELNILDGVTSTTAELNILDGVTSTAAELNIMDGNTSASSTTLVDADRVVTNDNGTMKQVALSDVKTYLSSAGFTTDDPTALAIALG